VTVVNVPLPAASPGPTLERALVILKSVAEGSSPTHTDLTRITGAPKGSVSKVLAELRRLGFVERVDGQYRPGSELILLSKLVIENGAVGRFTPLLEQLAAATGESAILVIEHGRGARTAGRVVAVDHVESAHPIRYVVPLGEPLPIHRTAAGRVLLAFTGRGPAHLPIAVADPEALEAELAAVRAQGFSISSGPEGAISVAVPVLDALGRAIAAISVVGLEDRVGDARATLVPEIARVLEAAGFGSLPRATAG
jgi:IclR family acetate operon transcriptional repressor